MNFAETKGAFSRFRGREFILFFMGKCERFIHNFDQDEDGESHNEKVDDSGDKGAVLQRDAFVNGERQFVEVLIGE